jgi:hypothetical protein
LSLQGACVGRRENIGRNEQARVLMLRRTYEKNVRKISVSMKTVLKE